MANAFLRDAMTSLVTVVVASVNGDVGICASADCARQLFINGEIGERPKWIDRTWLFLMHSHFEWNKLMSWSPAIFIHGRNTTVIDVPFEISSSRALVLIGSASGEQVERKPSRDHIMCVMRSEHFHGRFGFFRKCFEPKCVIQYVYSAYYFDFNRLLNLTHALERARRTHVTGNYQDVTPGKGSGDR